MRQAPRAPFFLSARAGKGQRSVRNPERGRRTFPLACRQEASTHPNRQPFAGGAANRAVAGWVGRSPRARRGGAWHFVFYASVRGWLWLRLCFWLSLWLWLWLWLCGHGAQRSGMPRARRTGRWHPGGTTCRNSGGAAEGWGRRTVRGRSPTMHGCRQHCGLFVHLT